MKRPQLSIFSITLPTRSLVFYFSISSSIIFLSFVLIWANKSSPSNIPLPAQQTTNCLEYFNTSSIVFGFTPSPLAATVPPLPAADHPTNLTTGDDFIDTNNVSVTESSPSKDLSVLKLTDTPSSTPENASSSYFENEAQAVAVLQHELHDDEDEKEEEEEEEEEEDSGGSELDIIFANNFTTVAQQIPPAAILIDKIETNTHEDQNVPSVNTTVEQNAPLNRTREEQTAPLTNTTEEQNAPLMNKTEEQNAPVNRTREEQTAPLTNTTEEQNAPLMNKTEEQNAPVNRTREEQTAPLTNTTEEQNAPLMNKTKEQNALILMNKTEEQNAAALSEKTVQAKTRKKKKAKATSFDQMTQISSSGPLLVEEDEKIGKLGGCDFSTRGRWVEDESYPLYTSRSCPFIEEGFSCNGRLDKNFTKWRWQPQDCDIPRFDARKMLEFIRGKRLVFVGDSINHNQWESMVCMLVGDKRNPNKPRFIRERSYSVVFVDYKCKVQFYPSVFLVEKVMTRVNKKLEQTSLRIDSIDRGSHRWREADILVFDTEHWWVDFKTNAGVNFFQEGEKIHPHLDVLTALRKGLMTWASWVDHYINPRKTQVFFRTSSPTHFSGGKWNLPQSCVGVSEPLLKPSGIVNEKDVILEEVLKQMKTRVTLLNTTSLSEYRMDAHPSDIRDCSHWCLPGIPDVWNELLYLHLRVSEAVGAQNDLHVKNASESDIFTNVTVVPAQSAPAATLFDKIENQNAPLVNTTKEQNEPTSLMNKADQEQNAAALSEKTVQVKSKKKKKKKARATSFDQMTQISGSGPLLVEEDKKIGKLGGCDFSTRGRWVEDESYPLYTSRSCPFIEEGFSCNGRLDKNYTKWRWQPQDCDIPRFDARKMLEFIRGKRLVFVGDSINKNQWQSMVCMLVGDKRNPNKPRFIRERSYSVVFVDYKCKVQFYPSVFLVEQVMTRVDHKQEQTSLRIDSIDRGSHRWREADILVFNTEHWWVDFKTNAGVNFFQEGEKIHPHLDVLTALRKGLMTWASWVDHYINPLKTQVFFRTSSPTHFSGGKWKLRQSCVGVSEPLLQPSGIVNEKDVILEEVLKQMKTRVTLLNTTSLSEYRMDAHPSDIRDCSHWCLPGIPDVWNELLYLHLRVSEAVGAQNDLHVKNEDGGASELDIFTNVTVVPAQSAPAATLFDKIENQNAPLVNTTKEQNEPTSLMNKTDQEQSAPISVNRTDKEQTAALMNKIERASEAQNAPILMNKADQEQNPPTLMNRATDEQNAALVEKSIKKRLAGKKKKKKKSIATSVDQKSSTTQISSGGGMQNIEENKKRTTKLGECDFSTRGRWVYDESYPLYTRRSCPFIYERFDCQGNGRIDKNFTRWRWQPQYCEIPRFDATKMLELMRGKRLLYVGDSINRNQFESMVCMLMGDIKDPKRPRISHAKGTYSFYFVDYKFTVEFSPSVFLVEKGTKRVGQKQEQTSLRIDTIDQGSSRWRGADILVFDTEHWWTNSKTNSGKNFYQEGGKIHPFLDVYTALRKGLMTWAAWVDKSINPLKTQVFFRTSSPTHFSGGQWKSGRSCRGATGPLPRPSGMANKKDVVLEEVVKQMKTRVTLLNITSMSEYRIDAHPSAIKDCSHWCLPGLPDAWNELLFLHLLGDS